MKTFKLTKEETQDLAERFQTPLVAISLEQVEYNYQFLRTHMPRLRVFYAMKSNPAEPIVGKMAELGSSFDVASDGEMRQLTAMGVAADRMIYANPFKTPQGMKLAAKIGVNKFTFDSESEIYKMAKYVPGGTVLLRLRVDNPKALIDLNKKFGAAEEDALHLLRIARQQGLDVAGLCFHVGSQSLSMDAHKEAFRICREVFDQAKAEGFSLHILDIGGGLPVPAPDMEFDLLEMAHEINEQIETLFPDTEIWAEPGRYICGTAMNLITSVMGLQDRNHQPWYFLDEGLYGTFSGVIFDHWEYELETFKQGDLTPATFAGPSCDSIDILYRDRMSVPLAIGDLILVPNCGAYTSASATEFNGFALAKMVVWEEVKHIEKAVEAVG